MARRRSRRAKRRRGRRRSRRHNSWFGQSKRHRRAARKGWRGRRRKGKGRRRKGKGHRRARRYNTGGAVAAPRLGLGALTAGFRPAPLIKGAKIVTGALANTWLSTLVGGYLPSMFQSGIGSYVTGLATAGLMGAGVGMVSPALAGDMFFGGVLEVVTRAMKQYVVPMIPGGGKSGIGDYLTPTNVAEARPLGYFGDYLTPMNAREARPLGDYYGDRFVQEELAGM